MDRFSRSPRCEAGLKPDRVYWKRMEKQYSQSSNKLKGPHSAEVLSNKQLSEDMYMLALKNSTIAKTAKAGQFVSVLCEDLLIRRPFSVAGVEGDNFNIIYKVKGKGTQYLAALQKGSFADLLGPLGNGFNLENRKSMLVGCGVGIAPMLFLSDSMRALGVEHKLLLCSQKKINLESLLNIQNIKNTVKITEDGSDGIKGRLDEHFEKILAEFNPQKIYTCGPNGAMEYISRIAEQKNIVAEAALERDFACGTGVCMGCVIQVKEGQEIINRRICKDGPVFKGDEVLWAKV